MVAKAMSLWTRENGFQDSFPYLKKRYVFKLCHCSQSVNQRIHPPGPRLRETVQILQILSTEERIVFPKGRREKGGRLLSRSDTNIRFGMRHAEKREFIY